MPSILGISAFYHDSAACILVDGEIVAAAQEERFTRKKHDPSYPYNAIEFVLNYSNLKLSEVNQIVFFEKPFLKFERLLETYVAFAPKGFLSFCKAMPLWLKEKLFQKNLLFNELKKHDIKAKSYHAGKSNKARNTVQEKFTNGKVKIIIATIAFGMGVDIPNIRLMEKSGFYIVKRLKSHYKDTDGTTHDAVVMSKLL